VEVCADGDACVVEMASEPLCCGVVVLGAQELLPPNSLGTLGEASAMSCDWIHGASCICRNFDSRLELADNLRSLATHGPLARRQLPGGGCTAMRSTSLGSVSRAPRFPAAPEPPTYSGGTGSFLPKGNRSWRYLTTHG
jgi:hypothetical protein